MVFPSLDCCLLFASPKPFSSSVKSAKQEHPFLLCKPNILPKLGSSRVLPIPNRRLRSVCFFNSGKESNNNTKSQDNGLDLAILKRWDVPWQWQTVSLTSLACGLSFVLTGLVEAAAIPYLGLKIEELSLDEKAEILFLDQSITTAVVLGVIYGILNTFQPLPDDVFRYNLREPFNLQKGWLLWAGIGLAGAVLGISLIGVAMSAFSGEAPQREVRNWFQIQLFYSLSYSSWKTDSLIMLLPLLGSSTISTACLLGITGVLAPILEETVFRGFFMVSLTKWCSFASILFISNISFLGRWRGARRTKAAAGRARRRWGRGARPVAAAAVVAACRVLARRRGDAGAGRDVASPVRRVPTPVAVLISAAAFALAHLTPGQFPQLFVLGTVMGLSYAHTRNLLTPITIHAFWNSGVIIILTFLQLQGYDIKELLQAT
ncbi:hypothetical protein Tsubulata_029308 [Turnera subulata]|uniref:CAAX prenyl protease 2/Lysostaphin resistance protein A-like domain-containing protein n=1 Tax=Turnera subulata TaxID=218843 RepID=A0A9Q0J5Z1_9ROSI|nr:hypothetical protein Tsubulata_029308 [Turnera subulata]